MPRTHENYKATKPLVLKAFKRLRKAGFVAHGNFACCGTCASSECFEEAEETGKEAVVWWHNQDEDSYRADGHLFIGFGAVKDDATDEETTKVGRAIAKALVDEGLKVLWNGKGNIRIAVVGKESTLPES